MKAEERTSAGTFAAVALVSPLCLVQQSFVLASPPYKTKPIRFPPQLDPVHAQLSSNLFRGTTKQLITVFFFFQSSFSNHSQWTEGWDGKKYEI